MPYLVSVPDSLVAAVGSLDVRAALRRSGPVWVLVEVDGDPSEDGAERVALPVLVEAVSQHGAVRWSWHDDTLPTERITFGAAIRRELEEQVGWADEWLREDAAQGRAA